MDVILNVFSKKRRQACGRQKSKAESKTRNSEQIALSRIVAVASDERTLFNSRAMSGRKASKLACQLPSRTAT
jgi:hypothetical protein